MKNLIQKFALMALFAGLLFVSACSDGKFCMAPKGDTTTETIPLDAITGIDLTISADVVLHQGPVQEVKVTAASNIIDNLERNVKNGIWEIKFDRCVRKTGKMEIDVTLPSLTYAKISGSGNINSTDLFSGESKLELSISGSGNIKANVDATTVETDIAGSGNITLASNCNAFTGNISGSGDMALSGNCVNESLKITGSGNFNAFDMLAENVTATITGSGNCNVNASQSLKVTISGSGDVSYKGTPTVDADISGSGKLNHVN